jgi:DNA-binding MarR family transcriptional regulator
MKQLHNSSPAAPPQDVVRVAERLFELAAVLGEAIDGWLAEQGLTRARAEVLWRLRHEGSMTQRELSQALRCSARNVTGLIDALQAAGLVARQPHPTDRRAILATLTEQGAAIAADMEERQRRSASLLFADLQPTELTNLVTAIDRVLARIREMAAMPSDRQR